MTSSTRTTRRAILQSALAAESECFGRDVDAFSFTKTRKHFEICAGAATDVEYVRAIAFQIAANAFEKTSDDPAPADKPPVCPLDLIHDRVGVLLHFLRQGIADDFGGTGHNFRQTFGLSQTIIMAHLRRQRQT